MYLSNNEYDNVFILFCIFLLCILFVYNYNNIYIYVIIDFTPSFYGQNIFS